MAAIREFSCFSKFGNGFFVNSRGDYHFARRNGKIYHRMPCNNSSWIPFITALFFEESGLLVVERRNDPDRPGFILRFFDMMDHSWVEEFKLSQDLPVGIEVTLETDIHVQFTDCGAGQLPNVKLILRNPGDINVLELKDLSLTCGKEFNFKGTLQVKNVPVNSNFPLVHLNGPMILRNKRTKKVENIVYWTLNEAEPTNCELFKHQPIAGKQSCNSLFRDRSSFLWVVEKNMINVVCKGDNSVMSLVEMNIIHGTMNEFALLNKYRSSISFFRDPQGFLCVSYLEDENLVREPLLPRNMEDDVHSSPDHIN